MLFWLFCRRTQAAEVAVCIDPHVILADFVTEAIHLVAVLQAARVWSSPFTPTARAESFIRRNPNLDDTIRRLQAYEKAGIDMLFAPGLPNLDAVRRVCASVSKPVNVMAGVPGKGFTIADLAAAGVKRISLAASLYRAAMTGMLEAAREVKGKDTFTDTDRILPSAELNAQLKG